MEQKKKFYRISSFYVKIYIGDKMDLVKENWTKQDGIEFIKYLESLINKDKVEWTKNIVNTNMPVLALKSAVMGSIIKQIKKGNYLSFLDLKLNQYYEVININGSLIMEIKDFDLMKQYLDYYVKTIDNWASSDCLKMNVKNKEEEFYKLSLEYIKSDLPFKRRIGLYILFKLIENDNYIDKIYEIMNMFYDEEEYYVNMMNAWLFCECFIKRREKTLEFLKTNKLNKFTINKGISKCHDSYRISDSDKEFLKKYKK